MLYNVCVQCLYIGVCIYVFIYEYGMGVGVVTYTMSTYMFDCAILFAMIDSINVGEYRTIYAEYTEGFDRIQWYYLRGCFIKYLLYIVVYIYVTLKR